MRFEALNRLWESVRESSHDFRASTDIFPLIDIEKMGSTLDLRERGHENGKLNRPVPSAASLDEVEQRIVGRIEEEKASSYQILEDQFQTFEGRLRNLDFEGQFGLIRQANASTLSDFKAEIASGVDELHGLRRDLGAAEDEMSSFKAKHKLDRAAKVSSTAAQIFKVSLIVFLVVFEMVMNGSFLAKGSEQGIVGGVTEAIAFAVLNIGSALLLSVYCVRFLVHRSLFFKLLGFLGLAAYICIAIAVNLALAHYREVSATVFTGAGAEVISRLRNAPLGLTELSSWMLFAVGLLFSVIAFIDGCYLTDPYPGFAGVRKRLDNARKHYIERKLDLIDNLRDIRDDHNVKIEEILRDLSSRRQECAAIIAHRTRTTGLFGEYQASLERTANALLTIYRDANRATRSEAEPAYFSTPYKLERLTPVLRTSEEWDDAVLSGRIQTAQTELSEQIRRIGAEFEAAVENYHRLDTIFPEASLGTVQPA
ncbi:hypothetical protein Rleg9DRAFT_7359 [Rhizobium leguminosarum bv. trifolii WSM597]|uniref:Transmembrane protein n=1 Tax=Rhizobium leguminosarum bv. trifolii WSM597 TaxID=754764 RepID=J0GXQ4_RHILT|nr:hypothetical protein [Rhizobium leguminosarum]EJB02323.1 hypothetical protein Rleg9DRAFT_1119 [Rhizobium leguminosarum bv. trifolii WSM597]EJB08312.1 hypothetical protein Rleg9DRAFT_7359 [Rhizobium leguminosarum bv. trifolii WSM597]